MLTFLTCSRKGPLPQPGGFQSNRLCVYQPIINRAASDDKAGSAPLCFHPEIEMIHAALNLFNNALYPDASRRVEPIVESLARVVRAAWTT